MYLQINMMFLNLKKRIIYIILDKNLNTRENRKWMARILRYYCHVNGLSLYFSSIVNAKLSAQVY